MTELSEQEFLERLFDVIKKMLNISKTQAFRFKQKWNENFSQIDAKPHLIREVQLNKEEFMNDIDERISTLKSVSQTIIDGFHTIKSLLETLYNTYFDSEEFKNKYSEEDQLIIKYLTAKEILGNVIQYNKLDHTTVPLKYNILARNYSLMNLMEQSNKKILENMNKIFSDNQLSMETVVSAMEEVEKDGLIAIKKEGDKLIYSIKKELTLSEKGQKEYNQHLYQLIIWPTNFWRSFYNIRELNITPSKDMKYRDFLDKTLSRSATQGLTATEFVLKNLCKYYERIKNESTKS